jgi:hypothetical protein
VHVEGERVEVAGAIGARVTSMGSGCSAVAPPATCSPWSPKSHQDMVAAVFRTIFGVHVGEDGADESDHGGFVGKIPTTLLRRLISLLIRSSGFVDQICTQCDRG